MADDPDKQVVWMLQDIRKKLDDHSLRFELMDQHFDKLERTMGEVRESVTTSLGLSAYANVRHENVAREIEALLRSTRRIEDLEARVARLEEQPA